ncbi:MAG: PEP-CTERM sorting domain-containing protein [Verrucomicrobia bacterium]|nr:PEP-CTERM sorting domain-containing protein [Verrucomicrobiota bacterium]
MPRPVRFLALCVLGALFAAGSARALIVFDYSSVVNNRFSSGFPGTPVENTSPSFIGAGYDFSGVGWQTGSSDFAVTMISPQNFITARHVAPANGSSVSFLNDDGVLKNYTVASTSTITYNGPGGPSDLIVGTLTSPISAADHIASYSILYLGTPLTSLNLNGYTQLSLLSYGKTGRVGTNTIDGFANGDLYPLNNPDGVTDSLYFYTDYDSTAGQSQAETGDSGSPTFATIGGQLTLVGVHSSVGTINGNPNPLTFDNFLAWPSILQQIAGITGNSGQNTSLYVVNAIPEPSAYALLAGLATLGLIALRRRIF